MDFKERVHGIMYSVRLGFTVRALNQISSERRLMSRIILMTYQVE